jgi:hypothetical protein
MDHDRKDLIIEADDAPPRFEATVARNPMKPAAPVTKIA